MYFFIVVCIFLKNFKKNTYQYHRKSLENYYNYLNINATINYMKVINRKQVSVDLINSKRI